MASSGPSAAASVVPPPAPSGAAPLPAPPPYGAAATYDAPVPTYENPTYGAYGAPPASTSGSPPAYGAPPAYESLGYWWGSSVGQHSPAGQQPDGASTCSICPWASRKSDALSTLTAFYSYVSTQFGRPILAL
nr:extensin-like [Aegilops tauschii subsp. strangulata]